MQEQNQNIIFIFIGSVLAFLATMAVELINNRQKQNASQKSYMTYARLQLGSVLKVLNKLKYSYENNGRYLPRDIQLLVKAIEPLNNMRNNNTILRNGDLQESLIDVIADLNLYTTDISNLDDTYPYFPPNTSPKVNADKAVSRTAKSKPAPQTTVTADTNRWLEKNMELVDLRRRIEDLIKILN